MQTSPALCGLVSLFVFVAGTALFLGAPHLAPLPFPAAEFETSLRLRTLGVSPYNRDLQYVVSVIGAAMMFVGLWTAPWRMLAAKDEWIALLSGVLLAAVGIAVYGPTVRNAVSPFHEGEWLALAHGTPYPLIHGYAINYLPTRVASALLGEEYVVGASRAFRVLLALAAYALVPLVYYQIARYSVGRGWANALAVGAAVAMFVMFHGTLFSVGDPRHGIFHAPIRDVPFIALVLTAIWLAVPYKEDAASADSHLVLRSACFGAVAAAGLLVNILNAFFFGMLTALLAAYLALCSGPGVRGRVGRFVLTSLAAFSIVAAVAEILMPGSMTATFRSIAHFGTTGRITFADQIQWIHGSKWAYHTIGASMSFAALGVAAVWLLDRLRRESVREIVATTFPYLVCLSAVAFSLFANTGPVTTTYGLSLLLPIALGCFASITLARSVWFPALVAPASGGNGSAKFVLALVGMTTLTFALAVSGGQALEGAEDVVRATTQPNRAFFPFYQFSALRQRLDQSESACTMSLPSDGTLLFALGRPSCLSVRFPIYDATRAGQAKMIEELKAAEPDMVHVASFTMDHPYPPYIHVPALARFVLERYRPDSFVEGRWFWSRAGKPLHRAIPRDDAAELPRLPLGARAEFDRQLRIPLPRELSPQSPWVGLLIYLRGQASPHAALVGYAADGFVATSLTVTGDLARLGGDLWLVGPGNVITRIGEIDPM